MRRTWAAIAAVCAILAGCDNAFGPPPPASPGPDPRARGYSGKPKPARPTPEPAVRTPAKNLATIDGRPDDAPEYQELLSRLASRYPEDETKIADITANVYTILHEKGEGVNRDKSCLDILKDLDALPTTNGPDGVTELATAYALIGTGGK